MGGSADPLEAEAASRLAASKHTLQLAGQYDAALQAVVEALKAQGFTPPAAAPTPAPPPAPSLAPAPATPSDVFFRHLRPASSPSASEADVVASIAAAFGKADAELISMLAATVKRPATDPFFASDKVFEAKQAAGDFAKLVGFESSAAVVASFGALAPADWTEAGGRLRALVAALHSAPQQQQDSAGDGAGAGGSRAASSEQRGTQVPKSSKTAMSASSLIISSLTNTAVIEAERLAAATAASMAASGHATKLTAIGEAKRIRETSYGLEATTYLGSDGTVTGAMPLKGEASPP